MSWLPLIVGAYLLGAVSFSLLAVRAVKGVDVRAVGSGNAGATNVLRTAGWGPALSVLAFDAGKGAAAVLAARALGAPGSIVGAAAVAVIVGHVFPLYHGFRGGKGVATFFGTMGALAPRAAMLAILVFVLVVATTRLVSLGSITAVGLFPPLVFLGGRLGWTGPAPVWLLASAAAAALMIVARHHGNLGRLIAGTEHRLGDRRRGGAE